MLLRFDGRETFPDQRSAVAVGVFDGVHRGHQAVIKRLRDVASARHLAVGVVTFDPHPATVLAPARDLRLVATLDQRLEALETLGVDWVRVVHFDERTAHQTAESFVANVLVAQMHAATVVVGADFHFGHDRRGDVAMLTRLGAEAGFTTEGLAIVGGVQRWSSTATRHALRQGDLLTANEILGRPFVLRGEVVHGDARGRDLGYPTANVASAPRQQLPGIGIYAGAARLASGEWWPAAISVGTRPQFYDDGELLVEVHLPGFTGDLYGQVMDVAFLERLRGEMTFSDVAALIAQIDADVARTREIFENFTPNASELLGWELGQRR